MSHPQSTTPNQLLRALSVEDYGLLEPNLERTELRLKQTLAGGDEPIEQVHFFEGGVASIVAEQEGGELVEVGLFGSEGMSGTALLLGANQSPLTSFVQIGGGTALVIKASELLRACAESPSLYILLLKFVHVLNIQTATTAASNAHYALPERLARWLLMCHDRVLGDQMELTHEFLAMMLGVRRSGVTVTLHTLEATRSIRSERGLVTVLDRLRLEEIAGDAYGRPEAEYRRVIGPFGKGRHGMACVG